MLTLHPQVSVRPEPFGARLYHSGTRRLSCLTARGLLDGVRRLAGRVSLDAALADIPPAEQASFRTALGTLEKTGMLREAG